jgi:peptidoglycan hydrolase-like protein with peptidoglycan-binding domain
MRRGGRNASSKWARESEAVDIHDQFLSRRQRKNNDKLQRLLAARDMYDGKFDGKAENKTQRAIKKLQRQFGLKEDGYGKSIQRRGRCHRKSPSMHHAHAHTNTGAT